MVEFITTLNHHSLKLSNWTFCKELKYDPGLLAGFESKI